MMSVPVANNVQYRLTAEGNETRLQFSHRATGPVPPNVREGMTAGWGMIFDRIRAAAEKKS